MMGDMEPTREQQAEAQTSAVRAKILMHAHDLFAHYGFSKTNIGDIASRCGMSPGNLYRYYRNKQAIGLAAVQQYFGMAEAAMDTVLMIPEGTPEQRIRKLLVTGIQHLVDELRANPKIVELAEFLCEDAQGQEILADHIGWKRARLAHEIQQGIAAGALRPCNAEQTAGTMLIALKAFWMPMTLATWREPDTIIPELEGILDLIFRGLRG